MHDLDPVFAAFSRGPALAELAADLGLVQPQLWQSMYIFKQPGIGGEVSELGSSVDRFVAHIVAKETDVVCDRSRYEARRLGDERDLPRPLGPRQARQRSVGGIDVAGIGPAEAEQQLHQLLHQLRVDPVLDLIEEHAALAQTIGPSSITRAL